MTVPITSIEDRAIGCRAVLDSPANVVRARSLPAFRSLAASGNLRQAAATAPGAGNWIRSAAFEVAMPLVWERHTRPLERRKGHRQCASGFDRLMPECVDGFTDDLESVVTALLAYRSPIMNVEGWITRRMTYAITDGYRVRRSREMGAQQKARVPEWLVKRLDGDPWLVELARLVLQWAGVRQTAGSDFWPLDAWASNRAAVTGKSASWAAAAGPGGRPRGETVLSDLELVLTAMKTSDAAWYSKFVEEPLGRKWIEVADATRSDDSGGAAAQLAEQAHLELVPAHERQETLLADAAAGSLAAIRDALAAGLTPRDAIASALADHFLADRAPGAEAVDPDPDGVVAALLGDPDAVDRLVPEVLAIVG